MRRTAMKKHPSRHRATVEFSDTTKQFVTSRSGGWCEMHNCASTIDEFHHRKMKSAGGKGSIANCLGLCSPMHRMIHDNPDWSYRHGALVRRHAEPDEVSMFLACDLDCDIDHANQ